MKEASRVYQWQRYWVPRSETIHFDEQGFFIDPSDRFGAILNPDAIRFEDIASTPCLVLLGEPGIGKTRALQEEQERIQGKLDPATDRLLSLDLSAYGSEERLVRRLFDGEEYRDWRAGNHQLHLFLDSLDECLVRIDTVAAFLLEELERDASKMGHLSIRLACRTAEWPSTLMETQLQRLWRDNPIPVGVFELAPLRRVDVALAAAAHAVCPRNILPRTGREECRSTRHQTSDP